MSAWRLKEVPEDFVVEELADGEPDGRGEHVLALVEKRGLDTEEVAARLARAAGVRAGEVGYAGRKDRQAVTRQRFSVPCADAEALRAVEGDGVRVLELARHGRKLRAGQLAGNRFTLVVRGVRADELAPLAAALARAEVHGFANAFGPQRFGADGRGHELGAHLVRREWRAALARFAAAPTWPPSAALDELREVLAREGRDGHRGLARLAPELPRELGALARQLARRRGDFRGALRALERRTLRFALSAWQAHGFERVLARRAARGFACEAGDLALGLDAARALRVTEAELARCEASRARGELAPSGPLFGTRAPLADGRPGDDERAVRAELGADPAALAGLLPGLAPEGARRPLLAWPREARVEAHPAGARLAFRLGPGSYATVLVAALEAAAAGPPGEGPLAATVSTGAGPMDPAESEDA